ncbi:universal stress protein [Paractinoplanes atraurantiacus]|uniref:Nucleotide-binding universal stress protein, UspA family n=1 Tax=Paractinoplanes atraurantiacus TaxID=1036182 RepID=A0A285JFN9_9ACTN|nr:universal stress protein [Actinoplanes atraurantiacus]SNY59109.1 Nucleotide-binding universal stress protein, UspA family [Actinoplanes atraurantiacus]
MTTPAEAPVVVGVDGSPESLAAVEVATVEAALRHRRLHLVHARAWPPFGVLASPQMAASFDEACHARAECLMTAAVARAGDYAPGLPMTTRIVSGAAADVLVEESRTAVMVVIGRHRTGPFRSLTTGPVERLLLRRSACPVLVVHAPQTPRRIDHDRTAGGPVRGIS